MDLFDLDQTAPREEQAPVLKVSEISALLKQMVEGSFTRVMVEGELSGWKQAASGHWYGQWKDETAVLGLTLWRDKAARMGSIPTDGTLVVATGKLTTYAARSTYQLSVENLEAAGEGALMRRFEELKKKLMAEGLFEESRKKPLPYLPRKIGIITSPTGAVIGDMLHRLEERCPREVVLWPVRVQGETAAAEVVRALEGFNRLQGDTRPDVLIVARGGGSLEDLMAFNHEAVVRAVAASEIPVISAIGHEPDFSLCDFAADHRAPTPTAAAERVVPVRAELLTWLSRQQVAALRAVGGMVQLRRERLAYLQRLLPDPRRAVGQAQIRLDETARRLAAVGPAQVRALREKLTGLERVLLANNPETPLMRGFALVTDEQGQVIKSATTTAKQVGLRFKDGERKAVLQ